MMPFAWARRGPDSPTGQVRGGLGTEKRAARGRAGSKQPENDDFGAPRPSFWPKNGENEEFWGLEG